MTKKITDFKPQKKNVNQHTLHGTRLLEKSVQADGWISAMTAAADEEIFDGSNRITIAAEKFTDPDGKEVEPIIVHSDGRRPVVVVRDDIPSADDPRARRLSIAANQITATDWSPDGELLAEWGGEDEAIRAMFADSEWEEITGEVKPTKDAEPQTDRAAELLEKWGVQSGDLWQIGEHRLVCGDCTDAATVARVLNAGDYVLMTDPPYGIDAAEMTMGTAQGKLPKEARLSNVENWDTEPVDIAPFVENAKYSCVWGAQYLALGLPVSDDWLCWDKKNPNLSFSEFELAWTNYGKRCRILSHHWGAERKQHITQKPLPVIEWALSLCPDSDAQVLDPYCGSGTTLVACENLRRRCRAIEISPAYVAVALERMATAFPALEIKRLE
jgi:hypothetical protein